MKRVAASPSRCAVGRLEHRWPEGYSSEGGWPDGGWVEVRIGFELSIALQSNSNLPYPGSRMALDISRQFT